MTSINHEKKLVSIVVPVFNEEDVVDIFVDSIKNAVKNISSYFFEIIFVDDGSTDKTSQKILDLKNEINSLLKIKLIRLSKNFGHQAAIISGLKNTNGDLVITMDVDLQDPPLLITELIIQNEKGFDIVLAKRSKRFGESFFKKFFASFYYSIIKFLSDYKIEKSIGDFRLMNRKSVEALINSIDSNPYIRGLVFWIGFKQQIIEYERQPRIKGYSKYSFKKMFNLGLSGVLNFSTKPLRISLVIGIGLSVIAIIFSVYLLYQKIKSPQESLPGFATLAILMLWGFSFQFLFISILSEYLIQLIKLNQKRPIYIEEKIYE